MCGAPESQRPELPLTFTHSADPVPASFFRKLPWPLVSSLRSTGFPRWRKTSETTSPLRRRGTRPATGGRSSAGTSTRASASETGVPSPASRARLSAGGSVSTNSIDSPPRCRRRRIAPRDWGTAKAAVSATSPTARAARSGRRRRRGGGASARTRSGVRGQSTARARSSRSRFICLPQPFERARRARLDGADRDVERRRRLVLGKIEQEAAGEHVAPLLRQPVEQTEQPLALCPAEHGVLGGGGRLPRGRCRPQSELLAPARGAAPVPRLVRDDPQQPGAQRLTHPEAAEGAPGLDERLLGGVLGVG